MPKKYCTTTRPEPENRRTHTTGTHRHTYIYTDSIHTTHKQHTQYNTDKRQMPATRSRQSLDSGIGLGHGQLGCSDAGEAGSGWKWLISFYYIFCCCLSDCDKFHAQMFDVRRRNALAASTERTERTNEQRATS